MTIVKIREAVKGDRSFVLELMQNALEPFYGGDHIAHGQRIFDAHIAGGRDDVGHFSFEQKMFIAMHGRKRVGMIHVVGKKQGTFKISPLIVDEKFRNTGGIGAQLLTAAEQYARSHDARQLYCTVAEANTLALPFFLKKGFIVGGAAANHYKIGITELMLYKDLGSHLNSNGIAIVPFLPEYADDIARIVIDRLSLGFVGVDADWIGALYAGYERRLTQDVNAKYKYIFVALQGGNEVVGVIGATPKKGQPVKLMPLVATKPEAFAVLVSEAPDLLRAYGHKLYTHIVPTVPETMILQKHGWRLEGLLPAAYHPDVVTQQWGVYLK